MRLAIAQVLESVEYGRVDQVPQSFSSVAFKHGDHVHFTYDAFVQIPAPGARGADRSGIEGGKKEAFRVEAGIVNEFLTACFGSPFPPHVALHDGAPCGFVA